MPTSRVSGLARVALALLLPGGPVRAASVRVAPVIHGTAISALNTALALTAWAGQRRTETAA